MTPLSAFLRLALSALIAMMTTMLIDIDLTHFVERPTRMTEKLVAVFAALGGLAAIGGVWVYQDGGGK